MCGQGSRWGKLTQPLIASAGVCWDSTLRTLRVCQSALWLHSAGSGLLSLGFQRTPSVHSQDPDSFQCQGLLYNAADEFFVPSSDFQTPPDLKFQNCLSDQLTTLTPPPDKQGLLNLEKRQWFSF